VNQKLDNTKTEKQTTPQRLAANCE